MSIFFSISAEIEATQRGQTYTFDNKQPRGVRPTLLTKRAFLRGFLVEKRSTLMGVRTNPFDRHSERVFFLILRRFFQKEAAMKTTFADMDWLQSLPGFPREKLALLPTPLHRLQRFGEHIGGIDLWMKRDDLTGLAEGGNKTRKLEFIVGDAIRPSHRGQAYTFD